LAGTRGACMRYRGTHGDQLQSLIALTIRVIRVIVTFSCEVTACVVRLWLVVGNEREVYVA